MTSKHNNIKLQKHSDFLRDQFIESNRMEYIYALLDYYDTLRALKSLKDQAAYARECIKQACPGFYDGYFNED